MSDEAKKSEEPKLRLPKNLDSSERADEPKRTVDDENAASETNAEAPRKTFKLRRPVTNVPFKPAKTDSSEQAAPESTASAESSGEATPPPSPTDTPKSAEFPPPPPTSKKPEASNVYPPPPPKTESKPAKDHAAKSPPKSQNYNLDDPFGDVLPKPDPKTGKRTTRAPFPAAGSPGPGDSSPNAQPGGARTTSNTKRIFHPGKTSHNSSQEASQQLDRKLQKLNAPHSDKKKSNHLTSILVIAALLIVLFACGAGLWYVLRPDDTAPRETTAPSEVPAQTTEAVETDPTSAQADEQPTEIKPDPVTPPPAPKTDSAAQSQEVSSTLVSDAEAVTRFLNTVHIGGMRTGTTPRVMLNEVTYQVGDIVEPDIGLSFEGIRDNRLLFKDKQEVLYMKSF